MPISHFFARPGIEPVRHLGTPDADTLLIVMGRNNYRQPSSMIERIIGAIHDRGIPVCWLETRTTRTFKLLDHRFETLAGPRVRALRRRWPALGRVVERLIKSMILLTRPDRWDYAVRPRKRANLVAARDLRDFLDRLPARRIWCLAHSAGGIVTSLASADPRITRLVCFGYPFRHPLQDEDPARTDHLARLDTPFLIIQGDQDPYGTAMDARRYGLSETIRILPVPDGHNYADLPGQDETAVLSAILAFLDLAPDMAAGASAAPARGAAVGG
ncbi:alpha/beta family hydrolase [Tistrella mobilis]